MKKLTLLTLLPILLLLAGCTPGMTVSYTEPSSHDYAMSFDTEVKDEEAVLAAQALIENNLRFAELADIDGYLSTIKSTGHENTRIELKAFFEAYDLEHTILDMTLVDQQKDIMLIEVRQQSVLTRSVKDADKYKDHVAIANYTIEKEADEWKIADTTMTDTFFIE